MGDQLSDLTKKEHMEHAMIIGLTVAIVLVLMSFGYSTYTFYKTKTEKTAEIFTLTGNVNNLSLEKSLLASNNTNLTLEIASLNDDIALLITQKAELTSENSGLTAELTALHTSYDDLSAELDSVQNDLDDCLNPPSA
jgi:chromosome segregation ATPase